jgi:hypothetical protein
MSVEDARTVEAKVLPHAESRTLAQVRASARYHRDRTDPKAAEVRREQAKAARTAWFTPGEDGDGLLCVRGPGERVYLAWLVLDANARKIRNAGDERSLEAIRHDLMLNAVLGKFNSRVQVQAHLHVPATTVAGISDDPGILAGYGAITGEACRELANGSAIWRRVFTDPITGTVKDVDRRTYRPPNALAEYIAVRDVTSSLEVNVRLVPATTQARLLRLAKPSRPKFESCQAQSSIPSSQPCQGNQTLPVQGCGQA